ncbi:hypothetical protein [Crucian carp herpesvirus]|uniref:ORF84 n=2 Tax=Cyprinid herpesvirus 2 TaxID=317878 RepID=A0A0Y0C724_CYHV2|nr:ORF84 [Cyprinid herpesvirus 2]APD51575.1 hypothetical protein [Crucian carp herpesvirus]
MAEMAALNARFNPLNPPLRVTNHLGTNMKGNNMQSRPRKNHHAEEHAHKRYRSRSPINRGGGGGLPAAPPVQPSNPPSVPLPSLNLPLPSAPPMPVIPLPPSPPLPPLDGGQPDTLPDMSRLPPQPELLEGYDDRIRDKNGLGDLSKIFTDKFVEQMDNCSKIVPAKDLFKPTKRFVEELVESVELKKWDRVDALSRTGKAQNPNGKPAPALTNLIDDQYKEVVNGKWANAECLVSAFVASRKGLSNCCCPYNDYTLINAAAHLDKFDITLRVGVGNPTPYTNNGDMYAKTQVATSTTEAKMVAERNKSSKDLLPSARAIRHIVEYSTILDTVIVKLPDDYNGDLNLDFLYDMQKDSSLFEGLSFINRSYSDMQRLCSYLPVVIHCKQVTELFANRRRTYSDLADNTTDRTIAEDSNSVHQTYATIVSYLGPCIQMVTRAKEFAAKSTNNVKALKSPAQVILASLGGSSADSTLFYDGMAMSNNDPQFLRQLCDATGLKYDLFYWNVDQSTLSEPKLKAAYALAMKVIDVIMQMLLGPLGYKDPLGNPLEASELRNKLVREMHTADAFARAIAKNHHKTIDRIARIKTCTLSDPKKIWTSRNDDLYKHFLEIGNHLGLFNSASKNNTLQFDTGNTVTGETYINMAEKIHNARKSQNWSVFAVCHLQALAAKNKAVFNNLDKVSYLRTDTREHEVILPESAKVQSFIQDVSDLKTKLIF